MLAGDSHESPPLPCGGWATDANVPPTVGRVKGNQGGAPRAERLDLEVSNRSRMGRAPGELQNAECGMRNGEN
jgi:hypothetical protein